MGSWPSRALASARTWLEATPRWRLLGGLGVMVLVGALVIKTAWLSDDAYITLRTVDNVSRGTGCAGTSTSASRPTPTRCGFAAGAAARDHRSRWSERDRALTVCLAIGHLGLLSLRIARAPRSPPGCRGRLRAAQLARLHRLLDLGAGEPADVPLLALFMALWWPSGAPGGRTRRRRQLHEGAAAVGALVLVGPVHGQPHGHAVAASLRR